MPVVDCADSGLTDEPQLTKNARTVLEARYLKKDATGKCLEEPRHLFHRVAKTIADVETQQYGGTELDRRRWEGLYYRIMIDGRFMPNSPTLMNAGREMGMLSACFVLPVRDSIVDIFDTIKHTALIQKAGGGTGFAFDELRPTGDYIKSSGGTTSGPISFWRAFSEATNAIQQGAFRRGANMGMMYIHHPDILKFLHAKQDLDQFTNYNISVKVTDVWMDDFLADPDAPHVVRNPRDGKAYVLPRELGIWKYNIHDLIEIDCVDPVAPTARETYFRSPRLTGDIPAELRGGVYTKREVWSLIVNHAWQTGEPGVVFIDRINEDNPTPQLGRIEATNPCGEQPLLPYEACNLGSINIGRYVMDACTAQADVDWEALRRDVQIATRFLDNVIDANIYPLPEIDRMCHDNRKIGLGLMGFADALFKLGVAYNSEAGIAWGRRFMKFLNDEAHDYSEILARERGCFPNWQGSVWHTRHNRLMRNAAVTTVAPTGTISILANCSGGIEPLFSLAFLRNVLRGQKQGEKPLVEVNDTFREVAEKRGFHDDELTERIAHEGTLDGFDQVPEDVKRVFVCAHDIDPDWHMRMQAAFQEHCDASISKTINFAHDATPEDVEKIYSLAYKLRCKGVTVYRDGCRSFQPMELKKEASAERDSGNGKRVQADVAREHSMSEVQPRAGAARESSAVRVNEPPTVDPAPVTAHVPAAAFERAPHIEPMDLPEIVSGFRIRQLTPFGNMHVKITVDPHSERELEIFAQLGKGGDVANSDLEGLCRTASLWLRAGGGLRPLIKQWEGIGSSMQIPTRAGRIMSLPDGLACALKKYTKAKERFGLRALLLGDINLSELDHPNPAPHHPQTTPADRPLSPVDTDNRQSTVPHVGISAGRPATTRVVSSAQQSTTQASETLTPKAAYVGRAPDDSGALHLGAVDTGVAVAEPENNTAVAAIEMHTETAVLGATEATETTSATEQRMTLASDLSAVLGAVKHHHDSASYYKVLCPECGHALVLQEGCRKCRSCGWAAC